VALATQKKESNQGEQPTIGLGEEKLIGKTTQKKKKNPSVTIKKGKTLTVAKLKSPRDVVWELQRTTGEPPLYDRSKRRKIAGITEGDKGRNLV